MFRGEFSAGDMKMVLRNASKLTAPEKMVSEEFFSSKWRSGRLARALSRDEEQLQLGQVVVAIADAVEGRLGLVVLDEVVLDAGFGAIGEDAFPVYGAAANVGEAPGEGYGWAGGSAEAAGGAGVLHKVFHVNQREAAGVFLEIGERIFAGDADPAEVEFHLDQLGIEGIEEKIVGEFAAKRFGRLEFEGVVVVGELDAGFLAGFAGFIEKISGTLPSAGLGALFFVNPGADQEFVAEGVRGIERLRPFFFDDHVIAMRGRRSEVVRVEHGANGLGSFIEVTGEFDFFVADGGDFGEGAVHVEFHGVAHGVKLQADRAEGTGGAQGSKRETGSSGSEKRIVDEGSSVHGR